MKVLKRVIFLCIVMITLYSTHLFADEQVKRELYVVNATGKYDDYLILKGYPEEDRYDVYFKFYDGYWDYMIRDNIKKLGETIEWDFNGLRVTNTRMELYYYFSDMKDITSMVEPYTVYSAQWFNDKYGKVYQDWIEFDEFCEYAGNLIGEYLIQIGAIKIDEPSTTQLPDSNVIIPEYPMEDLSAIEEFYAYDKDGNLLGEYGDISDINYFNAIINGYDKLPPSLTEGWISCELLKEIYGIDVNIDNDDIIFSTHDYITNKNNELLKIKTPGNWLENDEEAIEVDGIEIKKYMFEEIVFTDEWIDRDNLDSKFDIIYSFGDTVDEFKLYAPAVEGTYSREVVFEGKWSSNWSKKENNESVISGVRVKRENNKDYFNVEDLREKNIMPENKTKTNFYLNIEDLKEKELIH